MGHGAGGGNLGEERLMPGSGIGWKFTRGGHLLVLAGLAVLGLIAGCDKRSGEFLLVYSGDCQGYIEPCG